MLRRRWQRMTLAGRLLLAGVAFTLVAVLIAGAVIGFVLLRFIRGQVDSRLDGQILTLAAALQPGPDGTVRLGQTVDGPPFDRPRSGWYWRVAGPGLEARSPSLAGGAMQVGAMQVGAMQVGHRLAPPPPDPLPLPPADTSEGSGPDNRRLHVRMRSLVVAGAPVTIEVTAPAEAIAGPTRQALIPLVLSLVLLGGALSAAAVVQVRLGLRPLGELTAALARVREGHTDHVPDEQPSELAPFARELNSLLSQNTERLEHARRHVANLAHALKTPLATLDLALQDTESDPDGHLRELVSGITRRVTHHLRRARAAALRPGSTRNRAAVEPQLADLLLVLRRVYAERGIAVTGPAEGSTAVACEPQDLDEMLGNLLDNAFKWARTGVWVRVSPSKTEVSVDIADDGPGITPERLAEMLLPGRRLDEAVPGDGFGLPITQELAELYAGTLVLGRSPHGGLGATLRLPVAVAEPAALRA